MHKPNHASILALGLGILDIMDPLDPSGHPGLPHFP